VLVWGNLAEDEGTITGHIGRSLSDRKVMDVFPDGDRGKHAVTHYRVTERFHYVTLAACKLETGRTHQIRVHFKYLKHPVFNDADYGGDRIVKGATFSKYRQFVERCFTLCPRQALHAESLGFIHPDTGQPMHFTAPVPDDMSALIAAWRDYAGETG